MKRVIITGSTGLIGKEAILPLKDAGFEVFELRHEVCDLFDSSSLEEFFAKIKPQYLLHFAWITGGDYLANPINEKFVTSSMEMLKIFKKYGGTRAVFAGTCFEYKFKNEPIKENDELNPATLYAISKDKLRKLAHEFCAQNDINFGWGRIFYVFGQNEKTGRLTSTIVNNLRQNKPVTINSGSLLRDYMYTKDIANAFVKFLCTNVDGCVNIATGKAISLEDFALTFANLMGKEELVIVKNEVGNQPPLIVADIARLKDEVKFDSKYTVEQAVREILNGESITNAN